MFLIGVEEIQVLEVGGKTDALETPCGFKSSTKYHQEPSGTLDQGNGKSPV